MAKRTTSSRSDLQNSTRRSASSGASRPGHMTKDNNYGRPDRTTRADAYNWGRPDRNKTNE